MPGYGAPNATFCLPWPWLVNTVMNRLSPVSRRLPAPSSASITPAGRCWLPSPKIVSIAMPCVMYIIEPASATAPSPGSSSTSTNCISLPCTSKSMSCARRPGAGGGTNATGRLPGASGRSAFDVGSEGGHVLDLLPLRHAGGEHERLRVDAAVLQVGDDLLLADRSYLMATDGHVPLVRAVHCAQFSPVCESIISVVIDLRAFRSPAPRRDRAPADARAARGRCARRPTRSRPRGRSQRRARRDLSSIAGSVTPRTMSASGRVCASSASTTDSRPASRARSRIIARS